MNVWLALRGAPNALILTRLRHNFDEGPYNGPVEPRHANLFQSFHDWETVQPMFKVAGNGAQAYTIWSVNAALGFDENGDPDTSVIDDLQATYPGAQVKVLGAWDFSGLPFGMSYEMVEVGGDPVLDENGDPVLDENGDPVLTPITMERTGNLLGTPVYADDDILNFTPDDVTYDEDGNETSRTPATRPKDVNLLMGAKSRRFIKENGDEW